MGTWIAGRYTVTYNSVDMGVANDGVKISFQRFAEMVTNTDAYGDSDVDGVYRGMNVWYEATLAEYKPGTVRPVAPFNSFNATGNVNFAMGVVGRLDTDLAQTLVMTVVAGTPAATAASPTTLTAALAILDANFNVEWFFGPRYRKTPFRAKLYPATTALNYFTCT